MPMPPYSLVLLLSATEVLGHGAVSFPPPRNGIDGKIAPWNGSVPVPVPFDAWCAIPSHEHSGQLSGENGQACFWFSNGCTIGCEKCDGNTRGPVPKFQYVGNASDPPSWGWEGIVPVPNSKRFHQPIPTPNCDRPRTNATICDPALRTANTHAPCGSADDFYYYSPWRAPGSAPVIDSCGVAGGRLPGQGNGCCGAEFVNTSLAKLADRGSSLPPRPTGTVWTAGSLVEVGWTIMAYHGGGYQYRLCPADQPLNEKCFQKTPLDFVGPSALRWDNDRDGQLLFNATRVSVGTIPKGSTWSKNPIPRGPWGWQRSGPSFEPVCDESDECKTMHYNTPPHGESPCRCSGDGALPFNLEIVDTVRIPHDLPPGPYVLGWRWDCEESDQVWASCSDITIESAA
eukprot:m.1638000 g.1638000  ORF g.1638000 m.1638000 type:complete len:400 (-) comp26550_c0_seq1:266-1465(-)